MTHLKAGDEHLPWLTFSEVNQQLRITRGALDTLVLSGKIRWAEGSSLRSRFELCGDFRSWESSQMYYCVAEFLAEDAQARLTGSPPPSQTHMARRGLAQGETRLFEDPPRKCRSCERESPRSMWQRERCPLCREW